MSRVNFAPENSQVNPEYEPINRSKMFYLEGGTGQVKSLSEMSRADAERKMREGVDSAFGGARLNLGDLIGQIIKGIGTIFGGVLDGALQFVGDVAGALVNAGVKFVGFILSPLAGLFSTIFGSWNNAKRDLEKERLDGERALALNQANLADRLSDCEFFGTCTITETPDPARIRRAGWLGDYTVETWSFVPWEPFATNVTKGCHLTEAGVLVLDRPGLWDIYAQIQARWSAYGSNGSSDSRDLELCVFKPDAQPADMRGESPKKLYSKMRVKHEVPTSSDAIDGRVDFYSVRDTVMIPGPGYQVALRFCPNLKIIPGHSTSRITAHMIDTKHLKKAIIDDFRAQYSS